MVQRASAIAITGITYSALKSKALLLYALLFELKIP
jgi:hypothetical protein